MNGIRKATGVTQMATTARPAAIPTTMAGSSFLWITAALLILVGVVFQVGELGLSHIRLDNLWLVSVVASDLWNLVATRLGGPTVTQVLRYWPLLLVGLGFSIMLATQENRLKRVVPARKGVRYGL
jgi:hypothetical protein